ncbi:NIL domain-containing protein [Spirulina subsalsa]|uniref:NIL domain-containing protein n=1 Tax=Spirulina subsalsa TaxID=54311 RepID=UPI00030EFCFD|nr:NIL domain-containing protein [Spirulina subsalsa]
MNKPPALDQNQRKTEVRLRVRIPQQYHQEPVITHLASKYQLEVTILAAMLGANAKGDGWFDLALSGSVSQIESALVYLSDLDVEILSGSASLAGLLREQEPDGW